MKMIAKAKCEKCGRIIPVSEILKHKCEGEVPKHLRDVPEDTVSTLRAMFTPRF
jgi:hypothetical protein